MKVCVVHNEYGKLSGEEIVVNGIRRLLIRHGHEVIPFIRHSAEIDTIRFGKVRAFLSGIYSYKSRKALRRILDEQRPDIVHIHNLFPWLSPAILPLCREAGVPVVMTVHNYRLICPSGLHVAYGRLCEKCCGGREWWCVIRNCEANWAKSIGYTLRNFIARKRRLYLDNVTIYAVLTEFQRQRLIEEGYPSDRIVVIPNMAKADDTPPANASSGAFVGFAGRISVEKNIPLLLAAARNCPDIPFKAAGAYDRMPGLASHAPPNFRFLGHLSGSAITEFFASVRLLVMCSSCFEGFPIVIIEAMLRGKPVVCPRIGGLPEIVDDGVTGFLFEPGNAQELAHKIRYLWDHPIVCCQMGRAAREKALRKYGPEEYYERLMAVYRRAMTLRGDSTTERKM